jgi:RNA-dependent RNA polymerase
MNGHTISETYKPSGRAISTPKTPTTPTRSHASPAAPARRNYEGNFPGRQPPVRQPPINRPLTRNGENSWAHNQEYKIKILGMSNTCWTKKVHEAMSRYGNVVRIEIQPGARDNNAWVVFQPPPQQQLPQQVAVGGNMARWESSRSLVRTVPSPVDPRKHYHEINILSANTVDFGIRDGPSSMIAMHTVAAHGNVQLMLNLERKELDVQFPLKVDGRTRNFRFRLPFALLARVYKSAEHTPGQTSLIIPFDSPPQFFIQKYDGEKATNGVTHTSFSRKEKFWSDWNTWFRETDVVDGRLKKSLQETPLMNHKDTAIIDIGKSLHET